MISIKPAAKISLFGDLDVANVMDLIISAHMQNRGGIVIDAPKDRLFSDFLKSASNAAELDNRVARIITSPLNEGTGLFPDLLRRDLDIAQKTADYLERRITRILALPLPDTWFRVPQLALIRPLTGHPIQVYGDTDRKMDVVLSRLSNDLVKADRDRIKQKNIILVKPGSLAVLFAGACVRQAPSIVPEIEIRKMNKSTGYEIL